MGNGAGGGDAQWFGEIICIPTSFRENVNQMQSNYSYLLLLATTPAMGKGLAAPTSVDCLTMLSSCITGLTQPQGVTKQELPRSESGGLARVAFQQSRSAEDVVIQPRTCEVQAALLAASFSTRATRGGSSSSERGDLPSSESNTSPCATPKSETSKDCVYNPFREGYGFEEVGTPLGNVECLVHTVAKGRHGDRS